MAIGGVKSLAVGDQNGVVNTEKRTRNLRNQRALVLCRSTSAAQKVNLLLHIRAVRQDTHGVNIRENALGQTNLYLRLRLANRISDPLCAGDEAAARKIRGRGVHRTRTEEGANANARQNVVLDAVNFAVHKLTRFVFRVLTENFCEIRARGHGNGNHFGTKNFRK